MAAAGMAREFQAAPRLAIPLATGVIDVTAAPYSADNTGMQDSTAAIQAAISDHVGNLAVLYFPAGNYLVSDRLTWIRSDGATWDDQLSLWGEGRDVSTIRLADRSPGYEDEALPRAVVYTASHGTPEDSSAGGKDWIGLGEGNEAFRCNIQHLTIDCGDNPGAVGIDWLANNNAVVEWVRIRGLRYYCGISMERKWPGPCMLSNVTIEGGLYGVRQAHNETNSVLSHVTLTGQSVCAIYGTSGGVVMSIFDLHSFNRVPAVEMASDGALTTMVDCRLVGGAHSNVAIAGRGAVVAEGVRWDGYCRFAEAASPRPPRSYYRPAPIRSVGTYDVVAAAANFPTIDLGDPRDWAYVTDRRFAGGASPAGYGLADEAVRSALHSGSRVIVFPSEPGSDPNQYLFGDGPLNIPDTVEVIIAWHASLATTRAGTGAFSDPDNPLPLFIVADDTDKPLLFKGFRAGPYQAGEGVIILQHLSRRPILLDQMLLSSRVFGYEAKAGAGNVHVHECVAGRFRLTSGQRLWARQLDIEVSVGPKMDVPDDAEAWVLGMKTEQPSTILQCAGRAAVLGGFHSPVDDHDPDQPAFVIAESGRCYISAASSGYKPGAYFEPVVRDFDYNVERADLPSRGGLGFLLPLYERGN